MKCHGELPRHPTSRDRDVDLGGKAFLGHVVNHVENAALSAAGKLIMRKSADHLAFGTGTVSSGALVPVSMSQDDWHTWSRYKALLHKSGEGFIS